jgi:hypothetical protein
VSPRPIPSSKRHEHRRSAACVALAGVGLLATGVVLLVGVPRTAQLDARLQDRRVLPVPDARAALAAYTVKRPTAAAAKPLLATQLPRPVRILIPAIGVSAPVIPLGVNADHTMQVPQSFSQTGWFQPGPEPGEPGAAIVVGHVDSRSGPGVFFRLRALRRGDRIKIVLANRRAVRFVVTGSREFLKRRFPTALVYRRTPQPTLRLITCGGRFDSSTGHYVDNHIVFARLIEQP